jgi:hypothetical protein
MLSGDELIQLIKYSEKFIKYRYKCKEENVYSRFVGNLGNEGQTILNIGLQSEEEMIAMRDIAGSSGGVIAFITKPKLYNRMCQLSKVLKWNNVRIEQMVLSFTGDEVLIDIPWVRGDNEVGAKIIDLQKRISQIRLSTLNNTLDKYCFNNFIRPNLIAINSPGNELSLLRGAFDILYKHKPKLMLVCEDRCGGRERILNTFQYLVDLKYKGFFILDTIRVPLQNFDFDVYQNQKANFYCNRFIFQ